MSDMERYEIQTSNGPKEAYGVIVGPFAIRDVSSFDGPKFHVDHLFTGYAVAEFCDEDQAALFCFEANELANWVFTDPHGFLPQVAFGHAMNAAMNLK
jgi:hypothetical protein